VDSNQITGGRKTHGDKSAKPRPPQRTLNDPFGKPQVYLAMSSLRLSQRSLRLCVESHLSNSSEPARPKCLSPAQAARLSPLISWYFPCKSRKFTSPSGSN